MFDSKVICKPSVQTDTLTCWCCLSDAPVYYLTLLKWNKTNFDGINCKLLKIIEMPV